jgi:NAD(P)-dependent dehydrogenase (short-subunit alcohol dehydrogenase family)
VSLRGVKLVPRVILVTGAGGGIGRVLVGRLCSRGISVIASGRRLDQMADLAAAGAELVSMDVGDDTSVRTAFEHMSKLFDGKIDAVVHCAAIAPLGTVEFTSPQSVAELLNVNTLGALRVLQASLPRLRKSAGGRFIFVSSLWGRISGPFVSTYAASKHAIEALADSVRRETRGQNIHISVVEPGVVKTNMLTNQLGDLEKKSAALGAEERAIYGKMYQAHAKLLVKAERAAITAEKCAIVLEKCLDSRHPRPRYRVGPDSKVLVALGRHLPDSVLDALFNSMYKC